MKTSISFSTTTTNNNPSSSLNGNYRNVPVTKSRSNHPSSTTTTTMNRNSHPYFSHPSSDTGRSNSRLENPTKGPGTSSSSGNSNASVVSSVAATVSPVPTNGNYPPQQQPYTTGLNLLNSVPAPMYSFRPPRLFLTAVATAPPTRDLDLGNAMTELYTLKKISSMFRTEVKLSICPGLDIRGLLNTMAGTEPGEPRPDILHFIGHGATLLANALTGEVIASVPLLMTTTGPRYEKQADAYDASSIARTLSFIVRSGSGPRLIILQACKTAEFAKRLARAMPNGIILAWQTQVLDEGCHSFSDAFYRHLFATLRRKSHITAKDVLIAFFHARFYLGDVFKCTDPEHENSRIGGKRAIGVPILIAGGGIHRDDTVFEISPLSPEVFLAMGGEIQDYPWSSTHYRPDLYNRSLNHTIHQDNRLSHTTLDRRIKRNNVFTTKNQPISESDEGADEENTCDDSDNNQSFPNGTKTTVPKTLEVHKTIGRRTMNKSGTASLSSFPTQSGSNPVIFSDSSSQNDQGKVGGTSSDCSYSVNDNLRMSPMNVPNGSNSYETILQSSSLNRKYPTRSVVRQVNGTMLGTDDDDDDNDSSNEFGISDDNHSSNANDETISMQRGDAMSCYKDNMSDTAGFDMDKEDGNEGVVYSHDHQNEIYSTAEAVSYGLDGNGLPRLVAVQTSESETNPMTRTPNSLSGTKINLPMNQNSSNQSNANIKQRFVKKETKPESTNENENGSHESSGKRKRARTRAVSTSTSTASVTNAMGNNQRMIISIEPDSNTFTGMTCASNATLMDGNRNINLDEIQQLSKQVIVVDDDTFDTENMDSSSNNNKADETRERIMHGRTVNPVPYDDVVSPYVSKAEERTLDDNSLMDVETTNVKSSQKKKSEKIVSETSISSTEAVATSTNVPPKKVPLAPWLSDSEIPLELGFFDTANPVSPSAAKAYSRDIFMELPGDEGVTVYIGVDPFEDGRTDTLKAEVNRFRAELQCLPGATPIKGMLSPLAQSTAGSISTTSSTNKTNTSATTDTTTSRTNTTYTSTVTTTTSMNTNSQSCDSMSTLQNAQHASEPNISVNPPASFHRPSASLMATNNSPKNGTILSGNNNNNNNNTVPNMSFGPTFSMNNANVTNYPSYNPLFNSPMGNPSVVPSTTNPNVMMNQYKGHPNMYPYSVVSSMGTNNYMNMGGVYRPPWNNTSYNLSPPMNQPPNPIASIQSSKQMPVTQYGMMNNPNSTTMLPGIISSTIMNNNRNPNNNSSMLPSLMNNNNNSNGIGYGYRSVDGPLPRPQGEGSPDTPKKGSSPYMNYGYVPSSSSPSQQPNNHNEYFLASPPVNSQQLIFPLRSMVPQFQPSVPLVPESDGSSFAAVPEFDRDIWDGKEYINPKDMQSLLYCATSARYGPSSQKVLSKHIRNIEFERKEKEEAGEVPGLVNDDNISEFISRPVLQGKLRLSPLIPIVEKDTIEDSKQNDTVSNRSSKMGSHAVVISIPSNLGKRYISSKEKSVFDKDPLVQGLSIFSPPEDPVLATRYERITDKALVLYRIIRKLRVEMSFLRSTMATLANVENVDAVAQYETLSQSFKAKQNEITELAFHIHRYMCEKRAMDAGNPLNITFRIIEKKNTVMNNSNGNAKNSTQENSDNDDEFFVPESDDMESKIMVGLPMVRN